MDKHDVILKNDNYAKNKSDVEFSNEISEEQKNDLYDQSIYSNITDEQSKFMLENNN